MSKYTDQDGYELYDDTNEDYGVPVPSILIDSVTSRDGDAYTVTIDYPVLDGIWNIGTKGQRPHDILGFDLAARKAYVFDNKWQSGAYEVSIVYMEPIEYIETAVKILQFHDGFYGTVEDYIKGKSEMYDLEDTLSPRSGNMLPPGLDFVEGYQDGFHRAIWAMELDITEIPVIQIIDHDAGYYEVLEYDPDDDNDYDEEVAEDEE
jgi:hypothetical protein